MKNPPRASAEPNRSRRREFLGAGLLVFLALLVYLPVFNGDFLWDDDTLVLDNPLLKSWRGLGNIWFSTKPPDFFPLTYSLFWIEWRIWGASPWGYHLGNILLHGMNAVLVWRVLRQLNVRGAWLAAAIFAVHPVCVASVGWISELKNALSLFFFLASLGCFIRFLQFRTRGSYALALGLFVLAMFSKTSTAVLPVVLVLVVWYTKQKPSRTLALQLAPFFLAALCLGMIGVWFQWYRSLNEFSGQTGSLPERIAAGGWAVWFYFGKILAPGGLCIIYPRWEIDARKVWVYLPGVAWLAMLLILWNRRNSWGRQWFFALACFTVALFPTLGFINLSWFVFSRVSDHFQYLAMPAVIALAVSVAAHLVRKWPPVARSTTAGAAIAILGMLTWTQASVFASTKRLWAQTIERNPYCWVAQYNLGVAEEAEKNFGEAAIHYQAALADYPDHAGARYNLANVLAQSGQLEAAIGQYEELLRRRPDHQLAENNLGFALLAVGRANQAIPHFEHVLAGHPDDANAHLNLGRAYLVTNHLPEAQSHLETAARLKPELAPIVEQLLSVSPSAPPQ